MTLISRVAPTMNRIAWRWVWFPLVVGAAFVVMVGLNLNGSSISVLSSNPHPPGVVAGKARTVRADEYLIETPIAISDVRQSFPDSPWIGLSPIEQAATAHGGPTTQWPTLLKPQSWGYLALGSSHGLAVSWWWSYVIALWGTFALIGLLTRRPLLSAALAAVVTFTPYSGWWTAPPPPLYLGYTAAAAACLLGAWMVVSRRAAAVLGVLAGLFVVAVTLALYPPWEISLVLVLVALVIGHAIDARIPWRRVLATGGLGLGVAVVLLGAWYLQFRDAIHAQAATNYPGHHFNVAGGASWAQMLDAPLNFWMAGAAGATINTPGHIGAPANQSEAAASWLPLPVMALVLLACAELAVRRLAPARWGTRLGRHSARSVDGATADSSRVETEPVDGAAAGAAPAVTTREPVWTLALLTLAGLLLLGWSVLPLPDVVGSLTGLRRVEPTRTQLALGLDAVLVVAVASRVRMRLIAWRWPVLVVAALLTALTAAYAQRHLPWDPSTVPTALVLLSGLVVGVGFAGLLHRRVAAVAAIVLAAYSLVSWGLINPLQHGITPVTKDRLVRTLKTTTRSTPNPRVEVFSTAAGEGLVLGAKVRAAGLQSLSGTTLYPNAPLMRRLVPTQKVLWNNYAQYRWAPLSAGSAPEIVQVNGTQMLLNVDPCDRVLLAGTHPGWAVSDRPLHASCLTSAATVRQITGPRLYIYRVANGAG